MLGYIVTPRACAVKHHKFQRLIFLYILQEVYLSSMTCQSATVSVVQVRVLCYIQLALLLWVVLW